MPILAKEHGFLPVYIRLFDKPERSTLEALAALGRSGDSVDGNSWNVFGGLESELNAARARTDKKMILFFDQFEEFFTLPAPEQERQNFLRFIKDCVQDGGHGAKLVFGIRRDFFDKMSIFDDYIQDVFTRGNRFALNVFDTERARAVINASLLYANKLGSTLKWNDGLIERILSDLKFTRTEDGSRRSRVLPAELQIVCQMVQLRGWYEASRYPGKNRLITDYVADAIESNPNREQASRILLSLVSEDGVTRSKPMSEFEIARKSNTDNIPRVRSYLRYFDENCRLVNQVARVGPDGGKEAAYELAHDYLVTVLNDLSSKLMDKTRRANLLLGYLKERISYGRRERISVRELWLIWFYASHTITPEVRSALRKTVVRVITVNALALGLLFCIVALRKVAVHFDIQYEPQPRILVKQGASFLMPLLGSEAVVVDTGISLDDLDTDGSTACHSKTSRLNIPAGEGWSRDLEASILHNARTKVEKIEELDEDGRHRVIEILAKGNALDETTLKPLRALMEPPSLASIVPAQAVLLNNRSDEAAKSALFGLVNTDDPTQVAIALEALANVDAFDERALEVLGRRLARLTGDPKRDRDEAFLLETLYRLLSGTNLNRKPLAPGLRARLRSKSPFIVANAAILLGDDAAARAARSLLRATNDTMKFLGAGALIKLGHADEEVLANCRKLLTSSNNFLRINAANWWIKYRPESNDISSALIPVLQKGDADEVAGAASVLRKANADQQDSAAVLLRRLDDQSSEVAAASAKALVRLGVKEPKAVAILKKVATQGSLDDSLDAVLAIRQSGLSDAAVISQVRARYENGYSPRAKIFDLFVRGSTPQSDMLASLGREDDHSSVERSYARCILLNDDEPLVKAIRRLLAELESPVSEGSVAYRRAIQIALATVAATDRENTSPDSARSVLRERLGNWTKSPQLHHRLTAVETLSLVKKMTLGIEN